MNHKPPAAWNKRLRSGDFRPFVAAGFAEVAQAAFLQCAVLKFQRDLRRPAGAGFGHAGHDAHRAGEAVDHDFAQITFASGGNFSFAHAVSVEAKPGGFNVRMQAAARGYDRKWRAKFVGVHALACRGGLLEFKL